VLDTSVLIDLDSIDPDLLPVESAISSLSMAELAAGPHASTDTVERARRQDRLQRAEVLFDPLPFDADAARAYGLVHAAVIAAGRKARGPRAVDLLIAATAVANGIPLYTRNADDVRFLDGLVEVVEV
jgi:predicted nucleic acid-binding protein